MRVKLGRLSVSRPASVSDRDAKAAALVIFHLIFQIIQLADRFEIFDICALIHHGDPRAVVSAILELLKAVKYDLFLLFISDVAYDSTHFAFLV